MDRSKVIAIITGAIAIAISIAYLLIVQILDFRSEMVPAPMGIVAPIEIYAPGNRMGGCSKLFQV